MLEGNRVSRISVRGLAVASATAVTTVGAVVGVASGADQGSSEPVEAAGTTTLLADIPAGQQIQQASLTEQVQAQSDAADATARQSAEQTARVQAAKDAAAKKKAADEAAAKEKQRKLEEAASRGGGDSRATFPVKASYTVAQVKAMAQTIVGGDQFACFSNIVSRESGWNYTATNPSSGAYGLVQSNPGSKMASVASDWRTNPATQIKWGLNYMNSRYGSPCGAWSFWQSHNYY
ncbi:transglycosylase SLT domain-containing protein [Streptomyces sp. NPDC008139]|uniref:aggregation-promoting factor C-terminal-like domain-containing protein n=1 Tax=Streptomyces sp. NPDC008139 TaxID=3364814 RepID=UPI0036EAD9B0